MGQFVYDLQVSFSNLATPIDRLNSKKLQNFHLKPKWSVSRENEKIGFLRIHTNSTFFMEIAIIGKAISRKIVKII